MDSYNQAVASGLQMGLAAGAQRADRALRMQQLQSQAALQRMQEQRLAQELAIRMDAHDQEVQRRADMTKALARVAVDTAPALELPLEGPVQEGMPPLGSIPNPKAMFLEDALGKHVLPVLFQHDPTGNAGFNALADIARMKQERQQGRFQPGFETFTDPRTGRQYSGFRGSENSTQLVHQPEIVSLTDPNTGKPVSLVQQGNTSKNLPQTGNITARMGATAANALAKEAPHLSIPNPDAPGFRMIDPERWDEYERQSRITPADRSKLEQRIVKLQDTTRRLQSISEQAENIFGPKALAGTIVVDRVLATMNPSLAVGQRIQGREAARYTMEGLVRSLTQGQGALSNQDVNRIYAMFPELGRPAELANNPARSRAIISQLQKQLALDEITDAQVLGRKPSIEALTYVDPAYLIEELEKGRIQPEVFRRAFNDNVHKADVEALANQR
jgi:hypothetical protein